MAWQLLYPVQMNIDAMNPSRRLAQSRLRSRAALGALCLMAAAACARASAADTALADISHAAESAALALVAPRDRTVIAKATALDARLRFPACAMPLATRIDSPRGAASRLLVRVSCGAPAPWNVFVPVQIESDAEVLVMLRQRSRGETVAADDVRPERRRISGISENYVKSTDSLSGYRLRRTMPAGALVEREALEPAFTVLRGSAVTLVADAGGYRVESEGRALADAAPGQRVRVQNLTSLKIVEGVADNRGVVRIGP